MKEGQVVDFYLTGKGKPVAATVTKVGVAGPSTAKTLNLAVGEGKDAEKHHDVPHLKDATSGQPFWRVQGDEEREREAAAKLAAKQAQAKEATPAPEEASTEPKTTKKK